MTLAPPRDEPQPPEDAGPGTPPVAVVLAQRGEPARDLLRRAGLSTDEPRPVIVVSGGADDLQGTQLSKVRSTLGPAIRVAAWHTGAAVIDGGTASGVMELLGIERARDPAAMAILLGIAPAGKVEHAGADGEGRIALASHHTHFILADGGAWGDETELLADVAEELATGAPIVMVVAGGGDAARGEVREALRRGWQLFAIDDSGGIADEIAAFGSAAEDDASLLGLPAGSDPRGVGANPIELGRLLAWELRDEPALKDAWVLWATYDRLAVRLRRTFERFQASILLLGITATLVALVYNASNWAPLHWAAIAVPIVVSVMAALANRRAAGKRWVLLRAAAEAVKSEIYRYRTRTGVYAGASERAVDGAAVQQLLTERLGAIDRRVVQSDASGGALTPYRGPLPPIRYGAEAEGGIDSLSRLDAKRYVKVRVSDQLQYYRAKVEYLDRRRATLQLATLAAGGAGAMLAAVGLEVWIGLTTACAGAALAHMAYLQIDNTIVASNRAAAELAAIDREFRSGARSGELSPEDLEALVTRGEAVLTTELGGWVQQMTDALEQWQAEQSETIEKIGRTPSRGAPER